MVATNAIVGAGTRTGVGSSSERQMPNFLAWRSKNVGEPLIKDFWVADNIPEVKNGRALSGFCYAISRRTTTKEMELTPLSPIG